MITMRKVYAMLISIVALNILDIVTTFIGLSIGLKEANPLMQDLNFMPKLIWSVIFCLSWLASWFIDVKLQCKKGLRLLVLLLMTLVGLYVLVVMWNISIIIWSLRG